MNLSLVDPGFTELNLRLTWLGANTVFISMLLLVASIVIAEQLRTAGKLKLASAKTISLILVAVTCVGCITWAIATQQLPPKEAENQKTTWNAISPGRFYF